MKSKQARHDSSPDAMTDPVREDGGGRDAASALAFQLVEDALAGKELGGRLRRSLGDDGDGRAAFKLGMKVAGLRRACKTGKLGAAILRRVCREYGVNGHWLLTGHGTMKPTEAGMGTLDGIPTIEVLEAMEARVARLQELICSARARRDGDGAGTVNCEGYDFL